MMYQLECNNIDMGKDLEWPWNLVAAINQVGPDDELVEFDSETTIPADFMGTLFYVLHSLYPNEYNVLLMRFMNGMTLNAIARSFGLTQVTSLRAELKS